MTLIFIYIGREKGLYYTKITLHLLTTGTQNKHTIFLLFPIWTKLNTKFVNWLSLLALLQACCNFLGISFLLQFGMLGGTFGSTFVSTFVSTFGSSLFGNLFWLHFCILMHCCLGRTLFGWYWLAGYRCWLWINNNGTTVPGSFALGA